MIEVNSDGSLDVRSGLLFNYLQMVFNQFKRKFNIEHLEEKPEEGFRKFTYDFERQNELIECNVVCVLMTALFFEAYIYDYCVRKKSSSYFKKYLDKLDPVAKWVIGTKLFSPIAMNEDSHHLDFLRKIFKARNELVHHKTKDSNTEGYSIDAKLYPEHCLKFIRDFAIEMKRIDPDDIFADMVKRHLESWMSYFAKDPSMYPLLWEA